MTDQDQEQNDEIQEIIDNLPDVMCPNDIIILFLMTLDAYSINAEEAGLILQDVFGIYTSHVDAVTLH